MFARHATRLFAIASGCWLHLAISAVAVATEPVLSNAELSVIQTHGPWPTPMPPDPGNEYSGLKWAEKVGEKLFFQTGLSANGSVACSTCHVPDKGFSDARPLALGIDQGFRNTQGLFDVGLQRWFGWDGGADSLWAATVRPMLNKLEMGASSEGLASYLRSNDDFIEPVKDSLSAQQDTPPAQELSDEALVVLAAKTIGSYMRTLRSPVTPFDKFRDAVLAGDSEAAAKYPKSAIRGFKLFAGDANCSVCHFGANFSNKEFHDTGRPFFTGVGEVDPGRYRGIQRVQTDPYNLLGRYSRNASDNAKLKTANVTLAQSNWGQWRTPSLRNLAYTAPYMHDGSLETLRDVVDTYADIDPSRLHSKGESILKPLTLTDAERNDLVEFLLTLSASPAD